MAKDNFNHQKWQRENTTQNIKEEYVELMPDVANALGAIHKSWSKWRSGPMTEPSDIRPAQKELKGWIDRWFKQNIK